MQLPTPVEDLHDFFTYIWGTTKSGWVYLPTEQYGKWQGHYFRWPTHRDKVIQHVMLKAGTQYNVFFSPALFDTAKGTRDHVIGAQVLWVDFDGNAPAGYEWPWGDIPKPTLRVQSSIPGHQHVYWRLREFCDNVDLIEDRNRAIAYVTQADSSGWDANQILRPPHTMNLKRGKPVSIESWDR